MRSVNAISHSSSQRLFDHALYFFEEAKIFGKSTSMDIGASNDLATLGIDDDNNRDKTFFTQDATVF